MATTGHTTEMDVKLLNQAQWRMLNPRRWRNFLINIMPDSIKSFLKKILRSDDELFRLSEFYKYGGDRWAIRTMLKSLD